jgi:hypothetical protein
LFKKFLKWLWGILDCIVATASNDPESYMEGEEADNETAKTKK